MKQILLKNIEKAFNALGDLAETYTITRKVNTYDPNTSDLTSTDTSITVKGIIEQDISEYMDVAALPKFDLSILIQGQTQPPETGDKMLVNGVDYSIVKVIDTLAGNTSAIHQILVKR